MSLFFKSKSSLLTRNGCYSTKSAYHLLSNEAVAKNPGPSNTTAHKKFWLDIWSLNVPNKIRHFILRASNDYLPTKMNLLKRNVTANSLCDYSCCETEDAIHAIWGCPEVKIVWWELSSVDLSWQKNRYVSVTCSKEF